MKYLLGQYCMWTTFGKSNFFLAIFEEFMILFEQDAVDLSLEHTYTYQATTYLNLVAECVIFAWTVCFVDNCWEIKISLGDFRRVHDIDRP